MYSSCLFCHAPLGRNERIEHFPVGQRLAFDEANGRFWVICPSCKRWNLSPLEERWEAIEECERLFEATRRRLSADNIGLAGLADGLELVRVGNALRPEMAAWRFGEQLAQRRRQYRWLVAGALVAVGSVYTGAVAAGISVGAFTGMWQLLQRGYERATRIALPTPDTVEPEKPRDASPRALVEARTPGAGAVRIETQHARHGRVVYDVEKAGLLLRVPVVGRERAWYAGADVPRVLPKLMAKVNRSGGRLQDEKLAVTLLERVVERGGGDLPRALLESHGGRMLRGESWKDEGTLGGLPASARIALEMALHEQRERELLAGELIDLEFAWKEAEELARIADTLTSTSVDTALARLKQRIDGTGER
ncbi:MAG: hypothetical protein P3B98_02600 [Gemmatimonadota bacterium]|nr:hypothetical protein [Gemmatimonadota bacterium]